MELRRLGLETLHQISHTSGLPGLLYSNCPVASAGPLFPTLSGRWRFPPLRYLQERYLSLIEIAFQRMTLTCDALAALSPGTKRLKVDHESAYSALRIHILLVILLKD